MIKEKLVEKYGEKQAETLLAKFNENELYENGFLVKEYPEDEKWKNYIVELENKLKEKDVIIQDKEKELQIVNKLKKEANNESAERRKLLDQEALTKEEIKEKLILLEQENKELAEYKQKYSEITPKLTEYEKKEAELKEKEEAKRSSLLEKLDEKHREDAIQFNLSSEAIEKLILKQDYAMGGLNSQIPPSSPNPLIEQFNKIFN
jgi:hypothetical protein